MNKVTLVGIVKKDVKISHVYKSSTFYEFVLDIDGVLVDIISDNKNLKEIKVGDRVRAVGELMFSKCKNLKTVRVLASDVTKSNSELLNLVELDTDVVKIHDKEYYGQDSKVVRSIICRYTESDVRYFNIKANFYGKLVDKLETMLHKVNNFKTLKVIGQLRSRVVDDIILNEIKVDMFSN